MLLFLLGQSLFPLAARVPSFPLYWVLLESALARGICCLLFFLFWRASISLFFLFFFRLSSFFSLAELEPLRQHLLLSSAIRLPQHNQTSSSSSSETNLSSTLISTNSSRLRAKALKHGLITSENSNYSLGTTTPIDTSSLSAEYILQSILSALASYHFIHLTHSTFLRIRPVYTQNGGKRKIRAPVSIATQ